MRARARVQTFLFLVYVSRNILGPPEFTIRVRARTRPGKYGGGLGEIFMQSRGIENRARAPHSRDNGWLFLSLSSRDFLKYRPEVIDEEILARIYSVFARLAKFELQRDGIFSDHKFSGNMRDMRWKNTLGE